MFRAVDDFLSVWQNESQSTLKVLRALSDASLGQRVTPEGRSLGFIAWHITTTLSEMMTHAGLPVSVTGENTPMPASAEAIAEVYERAARAVAEAVKADWSDAQLPGEIPMYGQQWTRSFVLGCLIAHETHHRGQMTVLMRQAGLKVPGVYGPSKEEWAAYGAEPQP